MFIIGGLLIIALTVLLVGLKIGDEPSYIRQLENKLFVLSDNSKIEMEVNDRLITLEVASTSEAKISGLMGRKSLNTNSGMLFIYSEPRILQFWMKDTFIPLDIIFLDSKLEIIKIHENTIPEQTEERYSSISPSQYVIEMNAGWSKTNGIEVGQRFVLID